MPGEPKMFGIVATTVVPRGEADVVPSISIP
jgi:hypothetical protein